MIRVLIVDDHDFFRSCLVNLLSTAPDLAAVGECRDGAEVLQAARTLEPDVVLMDHRMPCRTGLEAAADLHRGGSRARVILFTSGAVSRRRTAAAGQGVVGHLPKGVDGGLVLDAVRRVAAGGTAWPEDLVGGDRDGCRRGGGRPWS